MCHLQQHSQLSNTVCNPHEFPIKNSHKALLATLPDAPYPSTPPTCTPWRREWRGTWGSLQDWRHAALSLWFSHWQHPQNNPFPDTMHITSGASSTCRLATSHRATAATQPQRDSRQMLLAAGQAICLWVVQLHHCEGYNQARQQAEWVNLVQACCSGCAKDRSEGPRLGPACPHKCWEREMILKDFSLNLFLPFFQRPGWDRSWCNLNGNYRKSACQL